MLCPHCSDTELVQEVARAGVVVDVCRSCGGVWLDEGEIFFFTGGDKRISGALERGLIDPEKSNRRCPRCVVPLEEGGLFSRDPRIDRCPSCRGLWFDGGELRLVLEGEVGKRKAARADLLEFAGETLPEQPDESPPEAEEGEGKSERPPGEVDLELDRRRMNRLSAIAAGMTPLPNLFFRSAGMLVLLYGLLGIVLITAAEFGGLPPELAVIIGVGIVLLQFLFGPFIMDLSLRWLYSFSWVKPGELPGPLREFITRVTDERKMRFPRVGLIHDGAPNAFTYGHTPNNARVVITQGILDLLTEEEAEAVVAHEIGHAHNWDMLLMTVANLVPLLLYYIYRGLTRAASRSRKGGGRAYAVAIGAYLVYILSQYLVLWFSRTRELHADRFAGEVTGDPNALSSALVKIAYGLASQEPASAKAGARKGRGDVQALGAFGIFDARAAKALAVTSQPRTGRAEGIDRENVMGAMQWDLWNPWAKYHEIHSTHPLVANRLNHLGEQAASMKQEPYILFNRRKPESYWDEFLVDIVIHLLPGLALGLCLVSLFLLGVGFLGPVGWGGLGFLLLGIASLLRTLFVHRGGFFPHLSISSLLRKVKVSSVRPVPVRLQGRIIGKGVPGLVWSEDFVLQDKTGILFMDYRQPWRIWEFFFGLLRAGAYQGAEVVVTGWYRRAPVPYLELKSISAADGTQRRCYVYHLKLATAAFLILVGLVVVGANLP